MKNTIKALIATAILSSTAAYAGTYSDSGYNAKLIDEVSERGGFTEKGLERGGFTEKGLERGGFNDKGLAKDVNPGWKKY